MICGRTGIAASLRSTALVVTSSAGRSCAAAEATTTIFSTPTATVTAATMEAAAPATVEPASTPSTAVETASAATVTATAVLSEYRNWRERESEESCQCYEGFERTGWAHNLYLP